MIWILYVVCGVLVFELIARIANRVGLSIRPEQIDLYIETLMRVGGDGGRIIFRTEGHRVEFIKRIEPHGPTDFWLVVRHRVRRSKDLIAAERWLKSSGVAYEVKTNCRLCVKCLVVDIHLDVALAGRI